MQRHPHTLPLSAVSRRSGYSFIELSISVTLFVVIMLSSLALLEHDTQLSRSTLGITIVETLAQETLFDIERELQSAQSASSGTGNGMKAQISAPLDSAESQVLRVDSTLGFPDEGMLVLGPGTPEEEILRYDRLHPDGRTFEALERGLQCTQAQNHGYQTTVLWAGLAEPVNGTGDGTSLELGGLVSFRGGGTGFSYRKPVDPDQQAGALPNYLVEDQIQWGAQTGAGLTLDGWSCIEFKPHHLYEESATGEDVNRDGDCIDTFDVGQLRRRSWDASDPDAAPLDLALGPTAVLQERCTWGGDLDGDGYEDPIFLWDSATRSLRVRIFVLGLSFDDLPVVRRIESLLFLRNEQGI